MPGIISGVVAVVIGRSAATTLVAKEWTEATRGREYEVASKKRWACK